MVDFFLDFLSLSLPVVADIIDLLCLSFVLSLAERCRDGGTLPTREECRDVRAALPLASRSSSEALSTPIA